MGNKEVIGRYTGRMQRMQNANDRPLSKNNITTFTLLPRPCSIIPMPLPGWHHAYFFNSTQVPQLNLMQLSGSLKKL